MKAAQIGVDDDCDDKNVMAEKYNSHIQDFIAKLPGVHSKNLRVIMNKGRSLDHLITLSQVSYQGLLKNLTKFIFTRRKFKLLNSFFRRN